MAKFPTIKEMLNAVSWYCDLNHMEYDEKTHTFNGVELVPYPCRDSGGSIDSVGFHERKVTIPFSEAYKLWEETEGIRNCVITPPVCLAEVPEEELPF